MEGNKPNRTVVVVPMKQDLFDALEAFRHTNQGEALPRARVIRDAIRSYLAAKPKVKSDDIAPPRSLCNCNWDGGHEPHCAVVAAHDRAMRKDRP